MLDSCNSGTLQKDGMAKESVARILILVFVFLFSSVAVYSIGSHYLLLADGSHFPSWSLSIAFLAFVLTFLMQPNTSFGLAFCDFVSCIVWGLLAVKVFVWMFDRRY